MLIQAQSQLPASGHSRTSAQTVAPEREQSPTGWREWDDVWRSLGSWNLWGRLQESWEGTEQYQNLHRTLLSLWLQSWVRTEWEFMPDREQLLACLGAKQRFWRSHKSWKMSSQGGELTETPQTFSRDWRDRSQGLVYSFYQNPKAKQWQNQADSPVH